MGGDNLLSDNRVGNNAKITRGDHNHAFRSTNNSFVVLTGEGHGADFNACDVGVVIQDVDVVVGFDSDDCVAHRVKIMISVGRRMIN